MAQLPGLVYATRDDTLFVNLFVGSTAKASVAGDAVAVRQDTRYPWDGHVRIAIAPPTPKIFTVSLRVPSWTRGEPMPGGLYRFDQTIQEAPSVTVNGERVAAPIVAGFASIQRRWQRGDTIELLLPMPARRVLAHEGVKEDRGKAAIQRGPLVYAIEAVDNGGRALDVVLPLDAPPAHEFRAGLLNGVEVITARAPARDGRVRIVTAVPYFAWANRGKAEMAVWISYR